MTETPVDARLEAAERGMLLAYWAELQPDATALVSGDQRLDFAELNRRANRLARALRRRGLGDGDAVALMCSNRFEFVDTMMACQRAGLRVTPVNWHLTGAEAGYIVDNCDARAFVADARFAGAAAEAASLAPGLVARLAVGGEIDGFESHDEAVTAEDDHDIEDPSLGSTMLYTSGTTGNPKGVHRARRVPPGTATTASSTLAGWRPGDDLDLCTGPLYHAAPLSFCLATPLANGVGVVLMDGWGAEETLRLVEAHRVTHTHLVPTMFHRLLSLPAETRDRWDISSLRFIVHGAAPCPVPVKKAMIDWVGPIIYEYYAATEGGGTFVTSEQWLTKPGTVGKPATPDHILIVGDDGEEQPTPQPGTIYIKAPEVGRFDYFKDDQKTAGAYRENHFTLGDVGYLDDDGWLFLTDRSAHLIISGGVNIYPAEIEATLLTHPAVGDVGVIGVPDLEWGERVVAVIEPQPGIEPSDALGAELIEHCRASLAHYKCPRHVEFTDELPRHDNGKLYKKALRETYRDLYAEDKGAQ